MKQHKILYVCNEDKATTLHRLIALRSLGIDITVVYTSLLGGRPNVICRTLGYVIFKLTKIRFDLNRENKAILKLAQRNFYHIVFVEKGLTIRKKTLLEVKTMSPASMIIHYCLDDHMNPQNLTRRFLKALPFYDVVFTNKNFNVSELLGLGAKRVEYFRNSYSEHFHRDILLTDQDYKEYCSEVTFIGSYERSRAEILVQIANKGVKVNIWGWGRKEEAFVHDNLNYKNRHLYGYEFTKVIKLSKINLCFLRKENRDRETTRSVEIPACGGFMLAERTLEHTELFYEDVHSAYFEGADELFDKIGYYLENEDKRIEISRSGFQRTREMKLGYMEQMKMIINLSTEMQYDK